MYMVVNHHTFSTVYTQVNAQQNASKHARKKARKLVLILKICLHKIFSKRELDNKIILHYPALFCSPKFIGFHAPIFSSDCFSDSLTNLIPFLDISLINYTAVGKKVKKQKVAKQPQCVKQFEKKSINIKLKSL